MTQEVLTGRPGKVERMANPATVPAALPMAVRRREFVAREIERAGMELFAERGYQNVAIADIATAAGVSRRTFFRHFGSKGELLHVHSLRVHRRVVSALQRRPSNESATEALTNAFLETAEMTDDEKVVSVLRNRVLQQTRNDIAPAPEAVEQAVSLIADRLDTDPLTDIRPRLLVWSAFTAARAASATWVNKDGTGTLAEHIQEAFRYMFDGWRSIEDGTVGSTSGCLGRSGVASSSTGV